ncbi:SDR family NAD(P)-dependent oxidoreductase [Zavarzinia compransoris]|uniref:SDR family NAD(P)-dependent oxidoreductase n=1 Tax=Zavarzinia compransoris TaxID=1264899 RepID=UPI001AAD8BDB|nr:SDR family oxidoreductase [Zavarzinia compransoris]
MTQSLQGRRALVTGGGQGIGAAVCRQLAALGAAVVVADIDGAAAAAVAGATGGSAVTLDVTDAARVAAAVAETGPFDILVNNAGKDQHAFFTQTTAADWQQLMAVNLFAVFAATHAVLPAMQARGFGRIVNIASEAGRLGSRGGAVYAAAKGGVIAFTKSIARENGTRGITANAVLPGPVDTPLLQAAVAAGGDKLLRAMTAATLVGRLGTPAEVAALVGFLAGEAAGFITGETIGVSGGMGCGG